MNVNHIAFTFRPFPAKSNASIFRKDRKSSFSVCVCVCEGGGVCVSDVSCVSHVSEKSLRLVSEASVMHVFD